MTCPGGRHYFVKRLGVWRCAQCPAIADPRATVPAMTDLETLVAAGMSDPAIADALGISARTVLRRRQRLGLESKWTPTLDPCGTRAAYRRGCKCAACRAANTADQLHTQALIRAVTPPRPGTSHTRWTPEEDAVLLSGEGSLVQRARKIGRTYVASRARLTQLRKGAAAHS